MIFSDRTQKPDENPNYSSYSKEKSEEFSTKTNLQIPKIVIDEEGCYENEKISKKQQIYTHLKNIILLVGWLAFTVKCSILSIFIAFMDESK